jgi:hypothetical protein
MSPFLAAFIAVDALITAAVVILVLRSRRARDAGTTASAPPRVNDSPFAPPAAPMVIEPPATTNGVPPTGSFVRIFGTQLRGLGKFTREQHDRINHYVRANWNGAADQLPGVLAALLGELERDAQSRGLSFDRETLKSMLAMSLHDLEDADVLGALEKVA